MNDLHSHGAFAGPRPATTCILTLIAEESWKTENRYRVPPPACFSLERPGRSVSYHLGYVLRASVGERTGSRA